MIRAREDTDRRMWGANWKGMMMVAFKEEGQRNDRLTVEGEQWRENSGGRTVKGEQWRVNSGGRRAMSPRRDTVGDAD